MTTKPTAAEILVAKTHFSKSVAEQYVSQLNDAEVATILELNELPMAKCHLNSFLALRAAKQAAATADEDHKKSAEAGVASANAEFVAGLKAAKVVVQEPAAVAAAPVESASVVPTEAPSPAAPEAPVSPETLPLRNRKRG